MKIGKADHLPVGIEFQKRRLDNGLTVVAERHPSVRSLSAGVWVNVGSAADPLRHAGVSHFIEHMVFKGTKRRSPLEIAVALESRGGELNAWTDREMTCYHAFSLSEDLPLVMDLLSDMSLSPTFPADQLEKERHVLLQELAQIEDSPDDMMGDIFFEMIWGKHPFGRPIIGSRKTIKAIGTKELWAHYTKHYRPESLVLSVAGNFEFSDMFATVEKCFASPKTSSRTKLVERKALKFKSNKKRKTFNSDQTHLMIGFETVGFRDPARFDGLILSFFLGGGMSSRLFQEVREKAGLAYSVDCDYIPYADSGVFTIHSALHPKSVKKCAEIIKHELKRLMEEPLSNAQLEVVKGQLRGTILLGADQMEVRQESLGRNELVFGRYISVEEVIREVEAVTPARVQKFAQNTFHKKREAVLLLGNLTGVPSTISVA